jgi:hypothetical protein
MKYPGQFLICWHYSCSFFPEVTSFIVVEMLFLIASTDSSAQTRLGATGVSGVFGAVVHILVKGGSPTMRLTCAHCKKTLKDFPKDDLSALLYSDEGVYLFCGKECKDQCFCTFPQDKDFDGRQQPTL